MDQTVYIDFNGDEGIIGTVADLLDDSDAEGAQAARCAAMNIITDIIGEIIFGGSADDSVEITVSVR